MLKNTKTWNEVVSDPVKAYDALAPHYMAISMARSQYLRAVEEIIVAHARGAQSLLDIGAGDAQRTLRIARSLRVGHVVVLEPSAAMRTNYPTSLLAWGCKAEKMPESNLKFDVILCLWNVLGHVPTTQARIIVLREARRRLSPGGSIFLDVNHRYNAKEYGWCKTFWRFLYDRCCNSEKSRDVIASWCFNNHLIHCVGHVFMQAELNNAFTAAALNVSGKWIVNYRTGDLCRFSCQGNLLYRLDTNQKYNTGAGYEALMNRGLPNRQVAIERLRGLYPFLMSLV